MKTMIKWFAGFFEDQTGYASSKRLTLFSFIGFFYMQVKAAIAGTLINSEINRYILYATVLVILFLVGAITTEFFKEKFNIPLEEKK